MPPDHDRTYESAEITREGRPVKLNPDASGLRGLAHPVRREILDILWLDGPATSTTLADRLGLRTGSTSYHLRTLAELGFIEEIPDRGNRRDRWWRARYDGVLVQYAEAMEAGAEQADATTQSMMTWLTQNVGRAMRFLSQDWSFDWRYAAVFNSYHTLVMDPEMLVQMRAELWDLISRYINNPSTAPDALPVIFAMWGFPYRAQGEPDTPPLITDSPTSPEPS